MLAVTVLVTTGSGIVAVVSIAKDVVGLTDGSAPFMLYVLAIAASAWPEDTPGAGLPCTVTARRLL